MHVAKLIETKPITTMLLQLRRIHVIDVLNLLASDPDAEYDVTDIYVRLRIDQSVASNCLSILKRYNLVHLRAVGKFRLYSANIGAIGTLTFHINYWKENIKF